MYENFGVVPSISGVEQRPMEVGQVWGNRHFNDFLQQPHGNQFYEDNLWVITSINQSVVQAKHIRGGTMVGMLASTFRSEFTFVF